MIRIFKTGLSSSSDSPEVLTAELGQQTSPGRRGFGPKSSGHRSPAGGAFILANKRLTHPFLAFVAVLAVGLLFLMPGGLLQAQDSTTIEYAENGKDPVATFTATDPEGATPIIWDIAPSGADPDGPNAPLEATDAVDAADFMIDKDGTLKFRSPPDYEASADGGGGDVNNDNTYHVVVTASDAETDGMMGYHNVTVMVTDVEEDGKVAWTVDPEGLEEINDPDDDSELMQFQVGAGLTASVSDGDISGATKTVVDTHDDVNANPTWRWYRSPSKTSMGTIIDGANSGTYTVARADVDMYLRAEAYYVVAGNVDQETASLTSDYPVLAARLGDNKLKFDPADVSREVAEGDKGMMVGAPVTATGNHGAVNYTLVGTGGDDARFKIDQKTGQITTDMDLDREGESPATADAEGSCQDAEQNSPDTECRVTVRATDASGDATADRSATNVFVDATVTIKLTDVDEKPKFSTGYKMVSVAENMTVVDADADNDQNPTTPAADGQNPSDAVYAATDPDGQGLTYRLMGPDEDKFQLSATRVLSFKQKPDYEMPADANRDNVYEVTVRASDGTVYADRMVMVTVINVDDEPAVSGPSSANFAENRKDAVATFTATDPEGVTPIMWSLAADDTIAGVETADVHDFDDFDISEEGVLTFAVGEDDTAPDFENPVGGAGGDSNTYKVVVVASDAEAAGKMGYKKVTVKVTNVAEKGKVTWIVDPDGGGSLDAGVLDTDNTPIMQFQVGASLTASVTDGDIEGTDKAPTATNLTWRWYRGSSPISDAETNAYTVTAADARSRLRVVATYRVGDSTSQETASLTSDYPVLATRDGDNKLKFDPADVSREVAEGDKGMMVGAPVTATGNHGAVNYTLVGTGGDDARFKIDQKTGQITTDMDLDREGESPATADAEGSCQDAEQNSPDTECRVTVRATDASGDATADRSATNVFVDATVTIKLTDVNEKPTFVTAVTAMSPKTIEVGEDMNALDAAELNVTYAAEDPEGLNVNLTLMGPDAARFSLNSVGVLSFKEKPDYEMPMDANRDNVYMVTVRASDGTLHEDRMVMVTVIEVNEAPEIIGGGLVISGASSRDYPENGMVPVGTYTASGPEAASARWTLEGDDASDFRFSSSSGMSTMLMFSSSPNYEMSRDADTDNTYMVTLKANDGENMDTYAVRVTVTNEKEAGRVALSSMTPVVGAALTATLTDYDGSISDVTWTWDTSSDMSTWAAGSGTDEANADGTASTYTPDSADDGMYLRATAMYTDGYDSGNEEMATTTAAVTAGDPLVIRYDTNPENGMIEKSEVITAINEYLDAGADAPSKADVIRLINLYLDG